MADSAVPISAGVGTNIDTATQANGDHRQVVVQGDPVNATTSKVWPWGAEVSVGLATLFYDAFTGALDTTDKWTVTGNPPSIVGGQMVMQATASSYNAIRTKDTIRANAGFTVVRNGIAIEASAAVGAGRFWGLGTVQGAPTATSLVADGLGFEIDQATGNLLAVTYVSGTRATIATLTRPSDAATHAYELDFRVTAAAWLVDGVIVASASFPNVQVVELPALIVRQNAASFTGTPAFVNIAHLTGQTDPQNKIIADPVVGTRQARVKAASTAAAATDSSLVVALHPSSPLPAGTNAIGSVLLGGSSGLSPASGAITAAVANTPGSAVTATTSAQVVTAVPSAGNATFHLVATAFVGTVIFEASVDAGLNYSPILAVREDGSGSETGAVLSIVSAFIRQYTLGLPGFAYVRVRCSAFTSGSLAVLIQPGPTLIEPSPSLAASTANIGTVGAQLAGTGTITSSGLTTSSFTVLAANANRKGMTVYNDSTGTTLYLALASTASLTAYTVQIPPGGYWELPNNGFVYTGIITGIASAISGNARVTELT